MLTGVRRCVVGLDFGTASARALVVDADTGEELGSSIAEYRHGEEGVLLDVDDRHLARQEPHDYVDALERVLGDVAAQMRRLGGGTHIVGIGSDSTGSTPLPLAANGNPVAFDPKFGEAPAAKAWLWKDHTGYAEAEELTAAAGKLRPAYLKKIGGRYSSEWFWAKILRCIRVAPAVAAALEADKVALADLARVLGQALTLRSDPSLHGDLWHIEVPHG